MSVAETSADSECSTLHSQPSAPLLSHPNADIGFTSFVQPNAPKNPQEDALQQLCKQILKSRLFCGFYTDRCYVQELSGYRDVVALQHAEKELEKLLLDIRKRLHLYYQYSQPAKWIGITSGSVPGISNEAAALQTRLWVELENLAFGQYWFSVRSIRFRETEIVIKLKMVRAVEQEFLNSSSIKKRYSHSSSQSNLPAAFSELEATTERSNEQRPLAAEAEIGLKDFVEIVQQWGQSIKASLYEFMSQDVNKQNIKGCLKFVGLLIFSLMAAAIAGIKFLGIFTLRFLFEFSRLTHALTPLLLKTIEFCNKIVGGFYLLLAMIWKDAVVNRGKPQQMPALEAYNRPQYKAIQYNVKQRNSDRYQKS